MFAGDSCCVLENDGTCYRMFQQYWRVIMIVGEL